MAQHASMTRARIHPRNFNAVRAEFERQAQTLNERTPPGLVDHVWMIDRSRGEAIGLWIFESEEALRAVEEGDRPGFEPHANPLDTRNADTAPRGLPAERAERADATGARIQDTNWFTVIGRD
jgi:hypothetical protein